MIGTRPPAELTDRTAIAAWYWRMVRTDPCSSGPYDEDDFGPGDCEHIQDLITGAIEAGVCAAEIPVHGFDQPQPLHYLLAPYRTVPGGLAERSAAARRAVLDQPHRAPRVPRWTW